MYRHKQPENTFFFVNLKKIKTFENRILFKRLFICSTHLISRLRRPYQVNYLHSSHQLANGHHRDRKSVLDKRNNKEKASY